MSNANGQSPPGAHGTYLKISSPGFSLELEGHPAFVMQSYDMVREDILRRLMDALRAPAPPAPPAPLAADPPPPPELPIPEPPANARASAPSFRDATTSPAARANNMRDIKARMASKQPARPVSSPNTPPATPPAPTAQATPDAVQSVPLNTQASIQVELPPLAAPPVSPAASPPAPSPADTLISPPPAAARAHYVWIYISHAAYNKVYVADLDTLNKSPLRGMIDCRRLRKIHIENIDLPAFKALFGEGRTLWTEPPTSR